MKRPTRLAPGDRVAVVFPAGPVPGDRLKIGCEILGGWGLKVVLGEHVLDVDERFTLLAGTDAARAADLQNAWLDDCAGRAGLMAWPASRWVEVSKRFEAWHRMSMR